MKILVISTQIFAVTPDNRYAGIERLVGLIAKGLADRGHLVSVAAPKGSKFPKEIDHINAGLCGDFIQSELQAYYSYEFCLKEFDAILDMSHSHWAMMKERLPALAFIWHDPKIMRCQEPEYNICALSNWQRERFEQVYGYRAQVLDPHCSEVPNVADNLPSFRFLFVGKMGPDKGALEAIKLARLAGQGLDIIGVPGPGDPPEYLEKVKSECDDSQIVYLGGVDDDMRWRLTFKANGLIYPVHYPAGQGEAHSHKSVDALMAGCPIVTYDQGAMREVIENGITGYVVKSEEEFVSAMRMVSGLDRAQVKARAERRWSVKATTERIEKALMRVHSNDWIWGKHSYISLAEEGGSVTTAPSQASVKYSLPLYPRQVRIDSINMCNAHCLPCHLYCQKLDRGTMAGQLFRKIVDDIAGWPQPPAEIVPVNFGEFLLNKDWLVKLQYIEKKVPAANIVIPTNGELLKEADVYLLASIKSLKWLNFSVNAYFRETYEAFMRLPASNIDHIVKIAGMIRQLRPDIVTCASLVFDTMYQSELERDRFIEFWKPLVNIVSINPAAYCDNPLKKPSIPLETACRSIVDGLTVLKDGRVVTNCCFDSSGELTVGNINEHTLLEIWNGEPLKGLVQSHNSGTRANIELCSRCTFA